MRFLRSNPAKLAFATLMMLLSVFLTRRWMRELAGPSEKAFYFDLSEKQLYSAARGEIPPIKGINDAVEDGVRAVVVSTNGMPAKKSTWRVAYLEKYTPEMQAELRAAKAAGIAPPVGRTEAQAHRLVRRPDDTNWVPLSSTEGEIIVSEWIHFASGDATPVICTP